MILNDAHTPHIMHASYGHTLRRTDWAKVSTDEDSVDLPSDTTESVLHNALTDMHRSGNNRQASSPSAQDSGYSPSDAEQG